MTKIIFHTDNSPNSREIERKLVEKDIAFDKIEIPAGVVGPMLSLVMDYNDAMDWVRKM